MESALGCDGREDCRMGASAGCIETSADSHREYAGIEHATRPEHTATRGEYTGTRAEDICTSGENARGDPCGRSRRADASADIEFTRVAASLVARAD